ncbi:GNAT family N-acetyltransferase [Shouchella sp. 1P09AA]|uniref:GNAT family N-acetyltransferase n=1 Tax=unclassified Shouchella TaxID=2893065 RepID=UPI0039A2F42D
MIDTITVQVATKQSDIDQCFSIREHVFIDEQGVSKDLERDFHDNSAIHLLLKSNHEPIGAARMRILDQKGKIERVCVLTPFRNKGFGEQFMRKVEEIGSEKGICELVLNAQEPALDFYLRLGYQKESERFYEAGIPHFAMKKRLR